jgi:GMP synthase (glutamine-hydrolysing)
MTTAMKNVTSKLNIPELEQSYVDALRALIRSGVMAAPGLENSPLVDLPVVIKRVRPGASPEKRAHEFIEALRQVIHTRLESKDAAIAAMLFGLGDFAGMPIRERYGKVAQLYNPYWSWESYRKEPLTRHLLGVYLALKREAELLAEPSAEKFGGAVVTDTETMPRARKVLIVSTAGPGLLATLLEELALAYEVVDLSKGEDFPDATKYAALVVLGGTDSANDTSEKMQTELARVRQALDAGVPYLGICLGLQVAVKASGGEVIPSVKEVGLSSPEGEPYSVSLTNLALTALGRKDPLFVGLRNDFRVFQLHGETVTTTGAMQLLATGEQVRNQIVKIRRNAYGIQSHFELTREMLQEWLRAHPDLESYNEEQVMAEFEQIEEVYTITGLSLLRNWLHLAGVVA